VKFFGRLGFGVFLSVGGLFVLAVLESTVFFWFPFGVDAAVILLTVRHHGFAWAYPIVATTGSVTGTVLTFWMGQKLGDAGLEHYVPTRRLESAKAAVRKRGAVTLALFGIIPPPFPFTAFVLAAGALSVDAVRFLGALALVRLTRFGVEALLAAHYGTTVLRWMDSDLVQYIVSGMIAVAIIGSAVSLLAIWRRTRTRPRQRKAA
jgi:membrane protein YqaA with SNARE-associated domain